jgi:rubrerythrin
MNVRKVYEYALQREREGFEFFQSNAERMSHASAAGIFRRLADEEQMHIQFIEDKMRGLEGDQPASLDLGLEGGGFFEGRAASELLDQTIVESMVPDLPILRMAYLIEHDLAEFYSMAAEQTGGDAKDALSALAQWERGHEKLFKNLHDKILQEYMEMPWGG